MPALVQTLDQNPTVAVKRNLLRLLQTTALPEDVQGNVARHCFAYLNNPKEAIAVRAFAITVLARLCELHPDLIPEFELVLQKATLQASPAIRLRIREARKLLTATFG